jgi:hypothetical protein
MKKSILDEVKKTQESNKDKKFLSHFLIGVDCMDNGLPNGSMTLSSGSPFETLGMIELLMINLVNIKEDILKKLSQKEHHSQEQKIDKLLSNLPLALRTKIKSIKERMEKAVENLDQKELDACKKELENLEEDHHNNKKDDDDDDDDKGFNINDFKGGIA